MDLWEVNHLKQAFCYVSMVCICNAAVCGLCASDLVQQIIIIILIIVIMAFVGVILCAFAKRLCK